MARLLTPVAKFWICKRGSHFAQEAMECLGGNGYVEEGGEGVMARIYREMPLNSIWEGAGNIMALDLLRALRKADAAAALAQELAPAKGAHPALDRLPPHCRRASKRWPPKSRRAGWRRTSRWRCRPRCWPDRAVRVRRLLRSRLGGDWGQAFGTLGARRRSSTPSCNAPAPLKRIQEDPMNDLILHHYARRPSPRRSA
jgi:putative acyl-CoA dehydrogenase